MSQLIKTLLFCGSLVLMTAAQADTAENASSCGCKAGKSSQPAKSNQSVSKAELKSKKVACNPTGSVADN